MSAITSIARVSAVGSERARRIKARREALAMGISDLARQAKVNRGQLGEYENDKHAPTEPWIRKVENALERLEREMGMDEPAPEVSAPHLIRITVEGVYGAKALIVEGAPEDQAQLEAMVDRIMRNLRGGDEADST